MNEKSKFAETYGGKFGAALPIITMFLGIIFLSTQGMTGAKNLWTAGFAGIMVGMFVYKDKNRFQEAVFNGLRSKPYIITVCAFYFAGILAQILSAGHLVDGLLYVVSLTKIPTTMLPLISFLICVVLSCATGTTGGTVSTVAPVMIPLAVTLGCHPGLICGAILGGSFFGDNLAPISDTTIISATTQETSVIKVVRSRFKYSIIGGVFSAIMFVIMGIRTTDVAVADSIVTDATYASSLVFLVIPVIIMIMMIKGFNLVQALMTTNLIGLLIFVLLGFGSIDAICASDGIIASGISGMANAATFMFFIYIVANIIREAGVLESVLTSVKHVAKTPRSAEVMAGGITLVGSLLIGGATSTMSMVGAVIRELLKPFKIARDRSANILDGMCCGVGGLLPHNSSAVLLSGLAISSGLVADGFSPLDFLFYNYHCIALVVIYWFAVLTGWGRRIETDEELAADGIVIE